jgi:RES domain-containing protein
MNKHQVTDAQYAQALAAGQAEAEAWEPEFMLTASPARKRSLANAAPLRAHVGWDSEPPGRVSPDFGSTWADENKTLILEVPSIVVEEESNVLINPRHVDVSRVRANATKSDILRMVHPFIRGTESA